VDLVQFLSDWLTYAADNVKSSSTRLKKVMDFMSLNAVKCDCGSIFARYLH